MASSLLKYAVGGIIVFALLAYLSTPHSISSIPTDVITSRFDGQPARPPQLVDETIKRGIVSGHQQNSGGVQNLVDAFGAGACAFDYDNDGWLDLFIVGGSGATHYSGTSKWWNTSAGNRLYRNLGGGYFNDVTEQSGLAAQSGRSRGMGCNAADLDNDGDEDLVVSNYGPNSLYENRGDGSFQDITHHSGLKGNAWSTSISVADADDDGLPDLYVTNFVEFGPERRTLEQVSGLNDQSRLFEPHRYPGQQNRLYRNTGSLRFEDVSGSSGLTDWSDRSFGSVWLDLNADALPDLIVLNGNGTPGRAFINQGRFRFREAPETEYLFAGQGARDLVHLNANNQDQKLYLSSVGGKPAAILDIGPASTAARIQVPVSGLAHPLSVTSNGFGVAAVDLNADGRTDIYQANGLMVPASFSEHHSQAQPDLVLLADQTGGYSLCENCVGELAAASSRGVVSADFDNDGDSDIYVSHNNSLGRLLINKDKSGPWVGIVLKGVSLARGHDVTLKYSRITQQGTYARKQGFLSSSDHRIRFHLDPKQDLSAGLELYVDGLLLASLPADSIGSYNNIHYPSGRARPSASHKKSVGKPPPVSKLQSAFSTRQRAEIITWLFEAGHARARPELEALCVSTVPDARVNCAGLLKHLPPSMQLFYLHDLIHDNKAAARKAALGALTAMESELAYAWFARALFDQTAGVRCQAASSLAFLFDQEEAVLRSKNLLVPHLMRGLDIFDDAETRSCFILALGASEDHHAVLPLSRMLNSGVADVKLAAVEALGRIREASAVAVLKDTYRSKVQTAEIRTAARLMLQHIGQHRDRLLDRGDGGAEITTRESRPGHVSLQQCDEYMETPFPALDAKTIEFLNACDDTGKYWQFVGNWIQQHQPMTDWAATRALSRYLLKHSGRIQVKRLLIRFARDVPRNAVLLTHIVSAIDRQNFSTNRVWLRQLLKSREPNLRHLAIAKYAEFSGNDDHSLLIGLFESATPGSESWMSLARSIVVFDSRFVLRQLFAGAEG